MARVKANRGSTTKKNPQPPRTLLPKRPQRTCGAVVESFLSDLEYIGQAENDVLVVDWFRAKANDVEYQLFFRRLTPAPEDLHLLESYFNAFSNIIFGSALTPENCALRFWYNEGHEKFAYVREAKIDDIFGLTQTYTNLLDGSKTCTIIICQRFRETEDPKERLRQYLGTLLHEMSHAYLHILAIDNGTTNGLEGVGLTGHTFPWLRITGAIETFAKHILKLPLWLGRPQALARELKKSCTGTEHVPFAELNLDEVAFMNCYNR
jgi:hypothetical protein